MRDPSVEGNSPSPIRVALNRAGWASRVLGTRTDVEWITRGTSRGTTVQAGIPPVFDSYCQYEDEQGDDEARLNQQQRVVDSLSRFGSSVWWLGYLDTGAHDVIFDDAPKVQIYLPGWNYVLIQGGATEALQWRDTLPDLMFPTDHSWLASILWDDDSTLVGGSTGLIEALARDSEIRAHRLNEEDSYR